MCRGIPEEELHLIFFSKILNCVSFILEILLLSPNVRSKLLHLKSLNIILRISLHPVVPFAFWLCCFTVQLFHWGNHKYGDKCQSLYPMRDHTNGDKMLCPLRNRQVLTTGNELTEITLVFAVPESGNVSMLYACPLSSINIMFCLTILVLRTLCTSIRLTRKESGNS